jgi:hypothetical protein
MTKPTSNKTSNRFLDKNSTFRRCVVMFQRNTNILVDKFAKKFMLWQGLCSCGLKTRVFVTSSNMNSNLYQKECLEKRVLPFIRQHRQPVKFWPDLASCHYSNSTMQWYEDNNVDIIPKDFNPPNCPELRPIEKYWAIVKRKLMKSGGSADTVEKLRHKWCTHADTVSKESVQKLMGTIKKKTREFIRGKNN